MATVNGIVETSLYVKDLARAKDFYTTLFNFELLAEDHRFCALSVAGKNILLLFLEGASQEPLQLSGGIIPRHGSRGSIHIAFSIADEQLVPWQEKLTQRGIGIESTVTWPRGGTSLYFRDLDGHLLELITPGVWTIY